MFNSMSAEVRNLLLVASELGGEAAQYVKVLRKEKERLLPLDAIQSEMEELKAQAEQASAAEASVLKALTKANDRMQVAEKNAASYKGLLELTRDKLATLQAAHKEAVDDKHAAMSSEERMLKQLTERGLELAKYKGQLEKQAEELEFMQTNRVHAEVYQNVAAERDRALAELRSSTVMYQREFSDQFEGRTELVKELQGYIKDERDNLAKVRTELEQVKYARNSLEAVLDSTQTEWSQARRDLSEANARCNTLRAAFDRSEEEVVRLRLLLRQRAINASQRALSAQEGGGQAEAALDAPVTIPDHAAAVREAMKNG